MCLLLGNPDATEHSRIEGTRAGEWGPWPIPSGSNHHPSPPRTFPRSLRPARAPVGHPGALSRWAEGSSPAVQNGTISSSARQSYRESKYKTELERVWAGHRTQEGLGPWVAAEGRGEEAQMAGKILSSCRKGTQRTQHHPVCQWSRTPEVGVGRVRGRPHQPDLTAADSPLEGQVAQ